MSVGHIARLLEGAGIATVIVATVAFRPRLEAMTPARILLTPHPMGRPFGAPHDRDGQRKTLLAALDLLGNATRAGTIVELNQRYRPVTRSV